AGRWTVNDEDKLPKGIEAYFNEILERLKVSDVGSVLTPMFCLIAWAKEPLTEKTIYYLLQTHHLSNSPRWNELVKRAIEHGHMMLQRRLNSDGEVGWTFYHDSFREHLMKSDLVAANREWAQRRWLEVLGGWKALESETSLFRYALRFFSHHLYDRILEGEAPAEPKISELFELARNEEFARTQEEVL
ncbi:MAG: hypothetical protein NZ937_09900, partial [Armatimonadetes bacterium]|nr:hypothetical protein [Armatimonadota bacterium]